MAGRRTDRKRPVVGVVSPASGRWVVVRVGAAGGPAGHLVVAVSQVAGQGGLGGGVHGAGLGQAGLALQVLDGRDGLRSHDAVDGALVVVQLAEPLLQRLDRRRRGNGRGGRLRRVGGRGGRLDRAGGLGGRGRGGGGRGGVAAGQARRGQHDQGGCGHGADDDGRDAEPGGPATAGAGGAVAGVLLAGGRLLLGVELGAHGGVSVFCTCSLLIDPVSACPRAKTLEKLPSSAPPSNPAPATRPRRERIWPSGMTGRKKWAGRTGTQCTVWRRPPRTQNTRSSVIRAKRAVRRRPWC
jgi:hypothetical protein